MPAHIVYMHARTPLPPRMLVRFSLSLSLSLALSLALALALSLSRARALSLKQPSDLGESFVWRRPEGPRTQDP